MSNEQPQVHRALAAAGITLHTLSRVTDFKPGILTLASQFTDQPTHLACGSLVIVGTRLPNDSLYHALSARPHELTAAGITSVTRIGDALAPGALAHAIYSGHRYARELDADPQCQGFRRDTPLRAQPTLHISDTSLQP
jgi:dimethylamine/trimethylamine dehydrogenase